jgi:subtilisin
MRRTLACLSLALLVAIPAVAPVIAAEPSGGTGRQGVAPTASPSAQPSPSPTLAPDPTSEPPPTTEPAPANSPEPLATLHPAGPSASATTDPTDVRGRPDPTGRYIVVLRDTADTATVVARHDRREGTRAIRQFERAFHGFTARLDRDQRAALTADPSVVAVVPDELIELTAQTTPTGVARVGAKYSATASLDGVDQRVDADVAIVDTGIASHPDLNIAGGYNCSTSDHAKWRDVQGHGTHVAGTVAALDNDFGVVGVAPGARLWAVKILNDTGYGLLSWYVCGLDWILAQRDPANSSRPLIEAVNMSVAKSGADDHACGTVNADILHAAICRVVAGGITVVAAAANDSGSATHRVPAAYDEVITVSALADTDGKPGGLGGNRCYSWGGYDKDDTFADFSNYGADIDLIAPGKCIWSTKPNNTYAYSSGTSMAAPAVTGAVALYKATRPLATPLEVKEALQYLGNLGWNLATDPDSHHEKLLDVSRVGKLGTFNFDDPAAAAPSNEGGGTISVPITIRRSSTFFERVRLSVGTLPAGWSATFSPSTLLGWDAKATTLKITIPSGVPAGTYSIDVRGSNQGRLKSVTLPVTVTNDSPTAVPPTAKPATGQRMGVTSSGSPSSVTVTVSWSAASDPSSPIVAYQVERRADDGPWKSTQTYDGSTRNALMSGLSLAAVQRFRLRAKDAAGNWSPWAESVDYRFSAVSDRSSSLTYAGTWKRATVVSATNQVRTTASAAGATVRTTFTGRGIAIVMPRSRSRGKVTVTIDGVRVATVDTYASVAQGRRVVWAKLWSTSARHTMIVRVSGTSGRPTVSLDGLVITR